MPRGRVLNEYDVENVRTLLDAGLPHTRIAEILKISPRSVRRIAQGEHFTQKTTESNYQDKTTDELLAEIIKRLDHLLSLRR